ncbi:hypothetical protein F4677DRAFT_423627 [Hypoxylon crocopeplum]|nr:hypothetical protein F4677DRAFT_423627 [Hypoxylon crocopeplum]
MADQPRRHRNRPNSKQMWDESDRRNNARDGKDDQDRDKNRDRGDGRRERDRRRSRSRSPRVDRRERHRDRGNRDRDWDRDRDHDRRRNKPREPRGDETGRDVRRNENQREDRGRHRDRDVVASKGILHTGITQQKPSLGAFRAEVNYEEAPAAAPALARDRSLRRSASPPRSPSAKLDRNSHNNSPLPTRSRQAGKPEHTASLQFRVGGKHHDHDDASRRPGEEPEDSRRRTETPTSHGGDAMDEDGDEDDVVVEEDDGLSAMQAMMGFGGFGTTKGTHVPGNKAGGVRKEKKTEYRQYMNRVGGFNRPLSPNR